tara:strand:+ start:611 stop:2383 length:1773 start_codon:yes stop_codon:yes gene_type:complete
MEVLVLAGLIGAGYYINDNKRRNNIETFEGGDINSNIIPDNNDLYDLTNYETSQQLQEVSAQELIGDMLSGRTNVIDSTQTMNNTHRNVNLNIGENETEIFSGNSDLFINKEDFLRDDRGYSAVPFYKGTASPTINLDSNHGFQASMGGAAATTEWRSKRETENIGDWYMPENIHGNQWGTDPNADFNRYIPGTMRTGELPFDQENVQHIDEKSFDNRLIDEAIANTRNIDNLRSLNNQQKTYAGRIIPGEHINMRGIEGQVKKNKVEKYHELGEDRNLVTTGAVIGSSKRPNQVMPDTNRQYLNNMQLGPAAPLDGIEEKMDRPFVSKSMKTPLDPDNNRNVAGSIRVTDPERLGYKAYPNERQLTEERTYQSNVKGEFEGRTINLQDEVRQTIKETTLDPANNGFLSGEMDKQRVYQQDGAKTTVKETTIDALGLSNVKGNYTENLQTRPMDDFKTTIREGTMYNKEGPAGSYISGSMDRDDFNNAETNPTKELISRGRTPTTTSTKIVSGGDNVNIDIKKIESDYLTQKTTGLGKVYEKLANANVEQLTTDKNQYKDAELLLNQIDPNLLNPFKSNPYTKSLQSYNY